MIKQNAIDKMKKDIETCKGLLKRFFQEEDWIPIQTEQSKGSINSNLREYFSTIDNGKWLDENKKRFGIALDKALVYSSNHSEIFEREGKKYKIDYSYTEHSEHRLFSAVNA